MPNREPPAVPPDHPPRVACMMMQRDETKLLAPWLAYHGHLFGFSNLYVVDNGSVDPSVLATLSAFEALGVHVDRSHPTHADYLRKGEILGDMIRTLDATGAYDLLVPSDCDEFIAKQTRCGFTCDRDTILAHLSGFVAERRVMRIPFQIANNPYAEDRFIWFEFRKTFFASGTFESLDHGHHNGRSRIQPGLVNTAIVHVHHHYRPYRLNRDNAIRKWLGDVPLQEIDGTTYDGPYKRLMREFMLDEPAYRDRYCQSVQFHFPQFRALLAGLAYPPHCKSGHLGSEPPAGAVAPDLGDTHRTQILLPPGRAAGLPAETYFDSVFYLARYPGIASTGMDPLSHFCQFGVLAGTWPSPPPAGPG